MYAQSSVCLYVCPRSFSQTHGPICTNFRIVTGNENITLYRVFQKEQQKQKQYLIQSLITSAVQILCDWDAAIKHFKPQPSLT